MDVFDQTADRSGMCSTLNPIFPWREAYSVHIPAIDGQHQQLIALINELHEAMRQGNGNAVLARILNDLVRYAQSHFAYEESLLQNRGYRDLAQHRAEHQKLTQQVACKRSSPKASSSCPSRSCSS